jgi:hypothetical protein
VIQGHRVNKVLQEETVSRVQQGLRAYVEILVYVVKRV